MVVKAGVDPCIFNRKHPIRVASCLNNDGCSGAAYDPTMRVCSLAYNDEQYCDKSPIFLHYNATNITWIHCLNCYGIGAPNVIADSLSQSTTISPSITTSRQHTAIISNNVGEQSGNDTQTETTSQFQRNCAIKFQARPLSERPSQLHAKFELELPTDSVELCATRCYQDGCTGAKFDPKTMSCALSYTDKNFCTNSDVILRYEATEPTWIHCVNCYTVLPHLTEETSVHPSDITTESTPPSSKFHEANEEFQEFLKKGCIVRFQFVKLEERPPQLISNFEPSFTTETAETCAFQCYRNGCTGAKFVPETNGCSLSYDSEPYCSKSMLVTLSHVEQPIFMHCLSCVPRNASVDEHGDGFLSSNMDALPGQEEKESNILSTPQSETKQGEREKNPLLQKELSSPAIETSGEEPLGNLSTVPASMDETTTLHEAQMPSESVTASTAAITNEELTKESPRLQFTTEQFTTTENSSTVPVMEESGEIPESEEKTLLPGSGEEPVESNILPKIEANLDETTTLGETQLPVESVATSSPVITNEDLTTVSLVSEPTTEQLTTKEESSTMPVKEESEEIPSSKGETILPAVEASGEEPEDSNILPKVQANMDETTAFGKTQLPAESVAASSPVITNEDLTTVSLVPEPTTEQLTTTEESSTTPVKEESEEISSHEGQTNFPAVEASGEEPVDSNILPKVQANMDETTAFGETQLPAESVATSSSVITNEDLTTISLVSEPTTEQLTTKEESFTIPVSEESEEIPSPEGETNLPAVKANGEEPVDSNILPKVQANMDKTTAFGETQLPAESVATSSSVVTNENLTTISLVSEPTTEQLATTEESSTTPVKEESEGIPSHKGQTNLPAVEASGEEPVDSNILPKVQANMDETTAFGETQLPAESVATSSSVVTNENLTTISLVSEPTIEQLTTTEESSTTPVKEESGKIPSHEGQTNLPAVEASGEEPVDSNILPKVEANMDETTTFGQTQLLVKSVATSSPVITNEDLTTISLVPKPTTEQLTTKEESSTMPVKEESEEIPSSEGETILPAVEASGEEPVDSNILPKVQANMDEATTFGQTQLLVKSVATGSPVITNEDLTTTSSHRESTIEHFTAMEESSAIPMNEENGEIPLPEEKSFLPDAEASGEEPVHRNVLPKVEANIDEAATFGEAEAPLESVTTGFPTTPNKKIATASSPVESILDHFTPTERPSMLSVKEDSRVISEVKTPSITSHAEERTGEEPVSEAKATTEETTTLGENQMPLESVTAGFPRSPNKELTTVSSLAETTLEHFTSTKEPSVVPGKNDRGDLPEPEETTPLATPHVVKTSGEEPVGSNILLEVQASKDEPTTLAEEQAELESTTTSSPSVNNEDLTKLSLRPESTTEQLTRTAGLSAISLKKDSGEISGQEQKSPLSVTPLEAEASGNEHVDINSLPKVEPNVDETTTVTQVPSESITADSPVIADEELATVPTRPESKSEQLRTTEESPTLAVKEESKKILLPEENTLSSATSLTLEASGEVTADGNNLPKVEAKMGETTVVEATGVMPASTTRAFSLDSHTEAAASPSSSFSSSAEEQLRTAWESSAPSATRKTTETSGTIQELNEETPSLITVSAVQGSEGEPVDINNVPKVEGHKEETTVVAKTQMPSKSTAGVLFFSINHEDVASTSSSFTDSTTEQFSTTLELSLVGVKEANGENHHLEENVTFWTTLPTMERSGQDHIQRDKSPELKTSIEEATTESLLPDSSEQVTRTPSASRDDGLKTSSLASFVFETEEFKTTLETSTLLRTKAFEGIADFEEKGVRPTTTLMEGETVEEPTKINNVETSLDETNNTVQPGNQGSASFPPNLVFEFTTPVEKTLVPTLPAFIASSSNGTSLLFDHGTMSSTESHLDVVLDVSQTSAEVTDGNTDGNFDDMTESIFNASFIDHGHGASLPINVGFVPGSDPDSLTPDSGEEDQEISKTDATKTFDYENTITTETLQPTQSTDHAKTDDNVTTTTEPPIQLVRDFIDALAAGSLNTVLGELKKYLRKPVELKQGVTAGVTKAMEQVDITNLGSFSKDDSNTIIPVNEGTTSECGGRLEFQTLPIGSLPHLNVTNDVAARTPADCAKKCFETKGCSMAGYITNPVDTSNGVCLLTSDANVCGNNADYIPQFAALNPFLISCIRCSGSQL
uniref:Apple domain-containing protein n=1 Tax=Angiostrongylus cantonensis TaxID=6313 RepID=A0A158PB05_ANGCA